MRLLFILTLALGALLAAPAALEASPLLGSRNIRDLDALARDLARAGDGRAVDQVLTSLEAGGIDGRSAATLRSACDRLLERGKASTGATRKVIRRVETAVRGLEERLTELDIDDRVRLARLLLDIDGRNAAAHAVLGHVEHEGRHVTTAEREILQRRAEIQAAVAKARRLPVDLEIRAGDNPRLMEILGGPGVQVRWEDYSIHSTFAPARLERMVREALRASALSRYLRDGTLEVPHAIGDRFPFLVLLRTKAEYLRAVKLARAAGAIDSRQDPDPENQGEFAHRAGYTVAYTSSEVDAYRKLVHIFGWTWRWRAYKTNVQPCLSVGHINWVCLTYFGLDSTGLFLYEIDRPERTRTLSAAERRQHDDAARLSKAGIAGSRGWLVYLVRNGLDPAWVQAMKRQMGEIRGPTKLKSTFVVEYLQETGEFGRILRESVLAPGGDAAGPRRRMEKALGRSLAEFEREWKAWLLPGEDGLLQQFAAPSSSDSFDAEAKRALDLVAKIRAQAIDANTFPETTPLELDSELCRGATLHARYLELNPGQSDRWPDAHEEYPGEDGFTVRGARAGLHSVIAPGVTTPEQAISEWMETYYHRLPLLDPGLLRIGWGRVNAFSVLDCASLLAETATIGLVVWPPDGMKNVPRRFMPEHPNPVPGEDQSTFGYAVTLQAYGEDADYTMKLFKGKGASATPVRCYFTSPGDPLNLELAPAGSYGLIPVAALEARTLYTAEAVSRTGQRRTWSFTTGR